MQIVAQVAYRDDGQGARPAGRRRRLVGPPDDAGRAGARRGRATWCGSTARLLDGDLRQAAGGFLYSNPVGAPDRPLPRRAARTATW